MDSQSQVVMHNDTTGQCSSLLAKDRASVLQQCLVQEHPVIIHPSVEPLDFNERIATGITLLQLLASCQGDSNHDIIYEARMVFYGENEFLIWWHGLREFISGFPVGESESPSVNRIVRNLTVRYDMRDGKNYGKDLVAELENLFHFSNATCLTLEIIGEGAADGSDFDTQLLVKEVSSIVKRLIDHFGTRFQIRKGFGSCALLPSPRVFSLTSYWDHPQDSTREKVYKSEANFEECMQVQVESWLREENRKLLNESSGPRDAEGVMGLWDSGQSAVCALFRDAPECFLGDSMFPLM